MEELAREIHEEHENMLAMREAELAEAHEARTAAQSRAHDEALAARDRDHAAALIKAAAETEETIQRLEWLHESQIAEAAAAASVAKEVAVESALEAQRLAHTIALEGELKRLEFDMFEWHQDNLERRKPINRLKAMIAKFRHGEPVFGQSLIDYSANWREEANSTATETNATAPRPGPFQAVRALLRRFKKPSAPEVAAAPGATTPLPDEASRPDEVSAELP